VSKPEFCFSARTEYLPEELNTVQPLEKEQRNYLELTKNPSPMKFFPPQIRRATRKQSNSEMAKEDIRALMYKQIQHSYGLRSTSSYPKFPEQRRRRRFTDFIIIIFFFFFSCLIIFFFLFTIIIF
jgi:hypothetical protein